MLPGTQGHLQARLAQVGLLGVLVSTSRQSRNERASRQRVAQGGLGQDMLIAIVHPRSM